MFTLSLAGGWLKGDYYDKFAEAKRLGFDAIEMLGWTGLDLECAAAAIKASGVTLSAILTQSTDETIQRSLDNTVAGIVWRETHEGFLKAVRETVDAAKKLGVPNVVCVTGNERHDVSRYAQHVNVVDALRAAAPIAEAAGVTLVLEPLNVIVNHKGYYLVTTAEAADIIREVASPNVKILYDVYHQQISEGNIIDTIKANFDLIGHVHLGDVPGRNQPGTGEINYPNVYKTLASLGYNGYAALECGCTEDVETACQKMLAML